MKEYRRIIYSALCTALIAVSAQLSLPLGGINMTAQTFAVAFCAYFTDTKTALCATGVYILLGACSVPVFSSFTGGFAVLFGPSGGFVFGFLPFAVIASLWKKHPLLTGFAGLTVCYLLGTTWYACVSGRTFFESVLLTCLPYVLKDVLSVVGAFFGAKNVKKRLPKIKNTN